MQLAEILGIAVLCALGFYALRLLASFRTGLLAKSWKQVTIGIFLLILAQIPFLVNGGSGALFGAPFYLALIGMLMRLAGMIFLILGLRAQSKVWRLESKIEQDDSHNPLVELKRG